MTELTHVWVSKYALTAGVKRQEIREIDGKTVDNGYVYLKAFWQQLKIGRDCALTEAEAIALADAMRLKKITSLKKQIAKLEKLRFGSQP